MSDKLEKLTQQIYEDGVVKAKNEAERILAQTEEEKRKLLRQAREEAEDILRNAKTEAEELKRRTESEVRMAGQQALALLRQKITDLVCVRVGESATQGMPQDTQFLHNVLELVMKEWLGAGCSHGQEFLLRLPQQLQENMQNFLLSQAKQELRQSLSVQFDEKVKAGFVLQPKDGSYRIGFTDEDFKALVQYFLRPRLTGFLFGEETAARHG